MIFQDPLHGYHEEITQAEPAVIGSLGTFLKGKNMIYDSLAIYTSPAVGKNYCTWPNYTLSAINTMRYKETNSTGKLELTLLKKAWITEFCRPDCAVPPFPFTSQWIREESAWVSLDYYLVPYYHGSQDLRNVSAFLSYITVVAYFPQDHLLDPPHKQNHTCHSWLLVFNLVVRLHVCI